MTLSPSPTTKSLLPCSRLITSAALTISSALFSDSLNSLTQKKHESVYSRAARDFCAWREQGILIQEKAPCVFAYSQRFTVPGTETVKERRGFIALGKLHDYADQVVFRHEQTLSKPKSDRLNLLKATRAHFGQIFMLYSDPAGSMENFCLKWMARPTLKSPTSTVCFTGFGG